MKLNVVKCGFMVIVSVESIAMHEDFFKTAIYGKETHFAVYFEKLEIFHLLIFSWLVFMLFFS